MKTLLLAVLISLGLSSSAQIKRVSLQASGLTCSMCSKAVNNALKKVSFVDKVQVDIKNQQYNISFKEGVAPDFDALQNTVTDAGFSVASFKVTALVKDAKLQKDQHLLIGNEYVHFLNGADKQLSGEVTFTVVDKDFTSAKNFKKYSSLSKMECVQTGRAAKCCTKENMSESTRIYHAII